MGSEIREQRIPEEAVKILKSLALKWDGVTDADALQVVPLKGAMTNEVYQIKWPTNSDKESQHRSRKVVVRIYGKGVDIFFDRENEIRTFEFMSKQGQGPRLLGRFSNGRIEEFIRARGCNKDSIFTETPNMEFLDIIWNYEKLDGLSCNAVRSVVPFQTLSAADLCDSEISGLIATKMKEFHDLLMPGPKSVCLWDRLRNWVKEAKRLSTPEEAKAFCLDVIEDEILALESNLSSGHQRIGFCHNDLQYGNIMMDEVTRSITIIDYEYSSYNPVAFDIANHFCEMAADYHTETPHVVDYSKYPGFEERQRFLHIYLSCSGTQPSDSEVDQLVHDVEKYTLASHLFWGLWGIISGHVNKIDFDYMEYARQRFQQYWLRKPELLNSSSPTTNDMADSKRKSTGHC